MLGKVVHLAARDRVAGVDNYVCAMWVLICTYPLETRPRGIAANLALDTLKAVKAERRSLRRGEVTPYPPDVFLEGTFEGELRRQYPGPSGDLEVRAVIGAAYRLGLVNLASAAALTSVYADGLTGNQAARLLGTSPGMIRYRCSTSITQLARHTDALADAA